MTLERLGPGKWTWSRNFGLCAAGASCRQAGVFALAWLEPSHFTGVAALRHRCRHRRRNRHVRAFDGVGAADYGLRTIVVQDAVCSASDEAHDAMIGLFSNRYGQHIETATTEQLINCWIGG